jgi:hypothetical protein
MPRLRNFLVVAAALSFCIGWSGPDPGDIVYPVNMTAHDGRLFVSDRYSGVHVYDVADPGTPTHLYTIPLRGNGGNAVVSDVLYASDYETIKAYHLGSESFVLVAEIERGDPYPGWIDGPVVTSSRGFGCACHEDVASPRSAHSPSTGSSYATFAVVDDYLYYLDYAELVTISVADPLEPKEIGRSAIGWEVETLHPTEHYLFMGGARGMYIYERSDPTTPRQIGRLIHARACDPVVVEGHTAYVTLRGLGRCGGARDALLSIDIKEPEAPLLICETPVTTPYGLAVAGERLYVSKGDNGFVLYDVAAPERPRELAQWLDVTKDFIWLGDVLYSMTFDEVNVYDVSDPTSPALLSTLE